MRIQALILIIPFTVFLTETASFVPVMKDACAIVTSRQSTCSMKTKKQDQCHNKMDNSKKTSGNNCDDSPDCSTCPVCYTFIFQPQYELPAGQFPDKKNYSLLNSSYTSFYTPNVWKPPNDIFCHS